jgi:hypothetical protein
VRSAFDADNPTFVYGPTKCEDLVRLPGTPWIVASYLNLVFGPEMPPAEYHPGPLQAIHMETHEVRTLFPSPASREEWDRATFPDCPSAPEGFSSHGLNVRPLGGGAFRLYVCNHGERHSVEIVDVTVDGGDLRASWRGGVPVSREELGVWPNGVAPLPEEGFVLSGFNVATWTPGRGWERLAGYDGTWPGEVLRVGPDTGGMANGVEVSPDGRWIYVADTLREAVIRVPAAGGEPTTVELGFHVDNVRWGEDGLLYACGADFPPVRNDDIFTAFNQSYSYFVTRIVVKTVDPETLAVEEVVDSADGLGLRYGVTSTALQVGDELWLGTEVGDRVAVLPRAAV